MKKTTKLALIALLVCLFIVSTAVLAACGGKGVLETYKPSVADKRVSDDFVLDKYIGEINEKTQQGKYKLKWTSSNTDVIKLTEMENEWLAEVTLADEEKEVILTAKTAGAKKEFKVRVAAFSASIFADNYVFPQSKATVFDDFDLETTWSFKGKTASIEWEVRADDSYHSGDYIKLNDAKNKCLVTPSGMQPTVQIHATFKYNNDTADMPYRFTVYVELSDDDKIDYWYTNTGVSMDLEGYVVAIAENDSNYSNVTFYMADKSWKAGYYIFRGGADASTHENLEIGSYVRVTGTTNTNYSGLIETNAGGNVTVVKDKSVSKDEVMKHVYAIDNDVIGDVPATLYHESQLVSLTGWTVKDVKTPAGSSNSETLMTLEKNGKSINIQMSGYMKGHYTLKDNTWKGIVDHVKDAKGKLCDITGVLGNYNGTFQILAVDKDWIKFTAAPAEGEPDVYKPIEAPVTDSYVKLAMPQTVSGKDVLLYATGEMSGYYFATSEDASDGALYQIIAEGEGYVIKCGDNYVEVVASGNYLNVKYQAKTAGFLWNWNETLKVFTATVGSNTCFLGTTTFQTIGAEKLTNGAFATNAHPAYFTVTKEVPTPVHPAVKVNNASKAIHQVLESKGVALVDKNGKLTGNYIVPADITFDLPATSEGVAVAYKLCWENAYVTYKTVGDITTFNVAPGAIHEKVKVRVDYTYSEDNKVVYTTYEYFTIETHTRTSEEIVAEEVIEITVPSTLIQGQSVDLAQAGILYYGVTNTWSVKAKDANDDASGIAIKNGKLMIDFAAPGDLTITLTVVVKHGDKTTTKSWDIAVAKIQDIIGDVTLDIAGQFAAVKSDWSSSYGEHTFQYGTDLVVKFDRASAQTSTITDLPVIGANDNGSNGTVYTTVSLTEGGKQINSVTFGLKQWTTKTWQSMYIEYTTDGQTWTEVANVGFKDKGTKNSDGMFAESLAATGLPAKVTAVRLAVATTHKKDDGSSENVQVGLSSIKLNVTANPDVKGPEKTVYTLTTSKAGSNNGYAGNCDVEVDGITWNIEGNSTTSPWRFGGKNLNAVDRSLTSKTAITSNISRIVVKFGACTITVNSVTLKVYKADPTADGSEAIYTTELKHEANGTVSVTKPADADWSNCYYKVIFNVTETAGTNSYVTISTMEFYA
ncbi:MAG: hypothetical protein J1G02_00720 [Clostridiales bacterium]|nr:hypothetical protein [Clostridiales bacterium]